MPRLALALTAAALLLAPASASATTQRYTTPTATDVSGSCTEALPCRIDHAVNAASSGDTVIVAPGTYDVQIPLELTGGVDMHGATGEPAPLLVGTATLGNEVLEFHGPGTLRHLGLQGADAVYEALKLVGATGEDLTVTSSVEAVKLVSSDAGQTILRDSVAQADSRDAIKLSDGLSVSPEAEIALRNVTAISSGASAVKCGTSNGRGTLVNVIARGATRDVDAASGTACSATHSSLRPALSPGLTLGAGIQEAEPLFIPGSLRPMAASPTVDAGTQEALVSAADPDGRERTVPDIGAYECCAPGAWPAPVIIPVPAAPQPEVTPPPVQTAPTPPAAVPAPELGESVVVSPAGRVRVRVPGDRRFRSLDEPSRLPVGTVVDATAGPIRLTSALDSKGRVQTGRFWGGRFKIRQGRRHRGMTTLALRGGDFSSCRRRSGRLAAASRVARDRGRRVVRRLWARDKGGRFRTHGHNSVATARGTAWVTRDRCDGTLTRVTEGAVAVRDRRAKRTVLVRAGHSYLARVRRR